MKIAVFSTHQNWTPHFDTDLEIIQNHLDKDDEVYHYYCNQELSPCDDIMYSNQILNKKIFEKNPATCTNCIRKRKYNYLSLKGNLISDTLLDTTYINTESLRKSFANYEDLKKYKINNFEIGEAVLSSIISTTRNNIIDLNLYSEEINHLISVSYKLYLSAISNIDKHKFDQIYVFNGRFAFSRAILRAAQHTNTDCYIHERGASIYKYELFKNNLPHSIDYRLSEINRYWESNENNEEKNKTGTDYFLDRMKGKEQSWYSFILNQEENKLPDNWDITKENIVIFNTSEDEFESIGQWWKNPIYLNQLEGIKSILTDPKIIDNPNVYFYLRIHPNLAGVHNSYMNELRLLSYPNLTIIDSESDISTYALIKNCNKVLTFGSSTGVEATFLEKPSILAGVSLYKGLNCTYNPKDHTEVIKLICSTLTPCEKVNALKWGYYFSIHGIDFKYFKASGICEGIFKGGKNYLSKDTNSLFVSIIIPTYNRSKLISLTLESFFNQNYPKDSYEIIVADNNSVDNTKTVIEQFKQKSPVNLIYIFESRQGVHYARNTAAKHAKGDILYYTDDDMIADTNLLNEIIKPFLIDKNAGSVSGKILPKWEVEPPIWIKTLCLNGWLSLNNLGDNLIIENYDIGVFSCHQAMRREVFFKSGGFNPENTDGEWIGDGETGLNIKIKELGYKFAYNGNSIIYHIIPPTRMTQKYLNKRLANQGNCDSYTDYRKWENRKLGLGKNIIIRYIPEMVIKFKDYVRKRKNNDINWRIDLAKIYYFFYRIKYDIRLIFSKKWRELVLKNNWLND